MLSLVLAAYAEKRILWIVFVDLLPIYMQLHTGKDRGLQRMCFLWIFLVFSFSFVCILCMHGEENILNSFCQPPALYQTNIHLRFLRNLNNWILILTEWLICFSIDSEKLWFFCDSDLFFHLLFQWDHINNFYSFMATIWRFLPTIWFYTFIFVIIK